MKEQTLFKIAKYIDDELISEAAEYMPSQNIQKQDDRETVYISAVRTKGGKRQIWKYSAAAAVLLTVAGGTLFITEYKNEITGEIKGDLTLTSNESETQSEDDTTSVSESEQLREESLTSESEVEPPSEESPVNNTDVEEKPERITPIRTVEFKYPDITQSSEDKFEGTRTGLNAEVIDSMPSIPTCSLGKEYFKEMSTEELFKYYGLEYMLPFLNQYDHEIVDENSPHGIYTSEDGSVYDINTFVFVGSEPQEFQLAAIKGKITITVGKKVKFGQEYFSKRHSHSDPYDIWFDEESDSFFAVYNIKGDCSVMISAKTDDIYYKGDLYDKISKEINEGISFAFYSFFLNIILPCTKQCIVDENGHITYEIDYTTNEYLDDKTNRFYPLEKLPLEEKRKLGLS